MKDCNELFNDLLQRTVYSGFVVVVIILILIIILSIIERKIEKFKQKLYGEYKKKEQEKNAKKQPITWEDSVFLELMKQNYEKRNVKK